MPGSLNEFWGPILMLIGIIYLARVAFKKINSEQTDRPQDRKNSPSKSNASADNSGRHSNTDAQLKSKLINGASKLSLFQFVKVIADANDIKFSEQSFERHKADLAEKVLCVGDVGELWVKHAEHGKRRFAAAAKQYGLSEEAIEMLSADLEWTSLQVCLASCAAEERDWSKLAELTATEIEDVAGHILELAPIRTDKEIATLSYDKFEELIGGGANLLFLIMPCRNAKGHATIYPFTPQVHQLIVDIFWQRHSARQVMDFAKEIAEDHRYLEDYPLTDNEIINNRIEAIKSKFSTD